ncbi:hypothetical protein BU23DRAFT_572663 [Bimuria novae-zelandiae CBS 107.79]|uniref:Uncharacterized protein n=1 Tax=Bimuria novae-zelandiae CBS 107.79 TaxID=1447943 RepID=A0A6A5UTW3_9PLEO|nr:hypothetical protein BU23DRAFT_572663 [Bimuria novae-zelandiae CBS 107.79]
MSHSNVVRSLDQFTWSNSYSTNANQEPDATGFLSPRPTHSTAAHTQSVGMAGPALTRTTLLTVHYTRTIAATVPTPTLSQDEAKGAVSSTLATSSFTTTTASSTTSLPSASPTPIPNASHPVDPHTRIVVGAFSGALALVLIASLAWHIGVPRIRSYLTGRKANKKAQGDTGQWHRWLKRDREGQLATTRGVGPQDTVSELLDYYTRNSAAPTTGTWPLRSMRPESQPVHELIRFPTFRNSSMRSNSSGSSKATVSTPASVQHDAMRSYETYHRDVERVNLRSDDMNGPYQSSGDVVGVEGDTVVRLRTGSPEPVSIRQTGERAVSKVASLGTSGDSDDEFEEMDLGRK